MQTKLDMCYLAAQAFFTKIEPLMRKDKSFGILSHHVEDLGELLNLSPNVVDQYLTELRKNNVLRKNNLGDHYCPAIMAEITKNFPRRIPWTQP